MATGVTFWWFPDEEAAFLHYLETTGRIMAVPSITVKTEGELGARPLIEFIAAHDPPQVLFGLEQHTRERILEPYRRPGGKTWYNVMSSCVVQYRRGKFRAPNKLSGSNLSAVFFNPSKSGTGTIEKDPEFKKWAQKVFRWVRNATPEWHQYEGYRVSTRVKQAIDNEQLVIVPP